VSLLRFYSNVFVQFLMLRTRCFFTYKEDVFKGVMDFRFIYADGLFASGTAKEFFSFVESKHISAGAVVFLNSPGGLVSEALDLGRAIRAARLADLRQTSCQQALCHPRLLSQAWQQCEPF
jgi:hypothetical protein